MSRRFAAWRAAARIARRDIGRNKGRSSLVALMVIIPILAASTLSVLIRSDDADPRDQAALQLGGAQASVTSSGNDSRVVQNADASSGMSLGGGKGTLSVAAFGRRLAAAVPEGDRVARMQRAYQQLVDVGDRSPQVAVAEFDYPALGAGGGPLEQVAGRAPAAPDEVVVTRSMQRRDGVRIGDRISYRATADAGPGEYTVVGVVGGLPVLGSAQVIGLPGALLPKVPAAKDYSVYATETSWFVAGPHPVTWTDVGAINAFGGTVISRDALENADQIQVDPAIDYQDSGLADSGVIGIYVVVVGLILLQVALMAGPAIAVGTRRNERALAVVAATGGEARHLRTVVLVGSALIGLVASATAAVTGAGLGAGLVLLLRSRWEVQFARVDVHLLDLAGLVAVGTLTTLAAALLPARRVGRLDVTAALTGRRPARVPRFGASLTGAVLAVVGLAGAWSAADAGQEFPAVLGLAVAEVGLVVASPAIVGLTARLSSRTSFASRYAFRDAARQRGRTAPAVAAVLAAIAGGTTAVTFFAASTDADRESYTSQVPYGAVQVNLDPYRPAYSPDDAALVSDSLRQSLSLTRLATIQEPADDAMATAWRGCPAPVAEPAGEVYTGETGEMECQGNSAWFAAPDAAAVFGTGDAAVTEQIRSALAAGSVVVFDRDWLVAGRNDIDISVDDPNGSGTAPARTLPAVVVSTGEPISQPLIPVRLARSLGVDLQPTQVVGLASGTPDVAAEQRAQQAVQRAGVGLTVMVERGYRSDERLIMLAFLGAAGLVALIGTFTAVGLAAAESRADLGTLAAVGAAPGTRRRLAAAQAAAIAVPGSVLGLVSGTAAGWVLIRLNAVRSSSWQDESVWHLGVPWPEAAALGVGIPVLAVLVGFLTVRSRMVVVRRVNE